MTGAPLVILREISIAALPREVFPYFTDGEKMVAWKAVAAELDARPGGAFRIDITGDGDVARGEYLEIDPPHRIVFTWRWERDADAPPERASIVEVTLEQEGEGTRLRLVHRGLQQDRADGSAAGWDHYLARLALAAAGVDPGPDPWATKSPPTTTDHDKETHGSRPQQGQPAAPLRPSDERPRR